MSMLGEHRGTVVRDLEQVFGQGTATGLPEGQLLRRFVAGRDEAAFSTLVSRHGPMVLGVCRRVLGTLPDADDAFQATFLVLLRRATALQDADSLGPWLYGVAWRVASRARSATRRRQIEEGRRPPPPGRKKPSPMGSAEQRELRAVLDEEINRLPEKYRRPLVLCYRRGAHPGGRRPAAAVECRRSPRPARPGATSPCAAGWPVADSPPPRPWPSPNLLGPAAQAAVPRALLDATLEAAIRDLTVGKVAGAVVAPRPRNWPASSCAGNSCAATAIAAVLLATSTLALAALSRLGHPGTTATEPSAPQAPEPSGIRRKRNRFRPPIEPSIFTSSTGAQANRSRVCG